jgi:hypothetical protein
MNRFITLDEEGFFSSGGVRVIDTAYGHDLLKNLSLSQRALMTQYQEHKIIVEAFDSPYVAHAVVPNKALNWKIKMPYDFSAEFSLTTLSVDEWDRFHGFTTSGIQFVLNRAAQMQFFNSVNDFDDDSITISGRQIRLPSLNEFDKVSLRDRMNINSPPFWNEYYQKWENENVRPGWELGAPTASLQQALAQIKIPKSRICVLGCGTGRDAAYLASQGHLVTAVDLSAVAIEKARAEHKKYENLKFIVADAFEFAAQRDPKDKFDIVYEHTFFCAIDPNRRNEIVPLWRPPPCRFLYFSTHGRAAFWQQ